MPTVTPARASSLLRSLAANGGRFQTIVVDNGTGAAELERSVGGLDDAELMRLESNLGYSRAVNAAVGRADGDALVLLNDDSVVRAGYVERIAAALDSSAGVVMAAGVMLDARTPDLIETAGIELDRTLLAYDYLTGEPVRALATARDPVGPSGAAAAFDREAFRAVRGFDEEIFAYLEDVDLVLRLRREGGACRLAPDALGTHEHSATLGAGSPRKDYLVGYGRGYLLRKWSVLAPRRLPAVLLRELGQAGAQALLDRNLGPVRGRIDGLRAGVAVEPYPPPDVLGDPLSLASSVRRRWRRRARLRRARD